MPSEDHIMMMMLALKNDPSQRTFITRHHLSARWSCHKLESAKVQSDELIKDASFFVATFDAFVEFLISFTSTVTKSSRDESKKKKTTPQKTNRCHKKRPSQIRWDFNPLITTLISLCNIVY